MTPTTKTAAELLTDEFLEQTLDDIKRALPGGMDGWTIKQTKRRMLRERILARLAEGA